MYIGSVCRRSVTAATVGTESTGWRMRNVDGRSGHDQHCVGHLSLYWQNVSAIFDNRRL